LTPRRVATDVLLDGLGLLAESIRLDRVTRKVVGWRMKVRRRD
jgi:hypothetical protein